MTAANKALDVFIRHVSNHFKQLWVLAEEMLADVSTITEAVVLDIHHQHIR